MIDASLCAISKLCLTSLLAFRAHPVGDKWTKEGGKKVDRRREDRASERTEKREDLVYHGKTSLCERINYLRFLLLLFPRAAGVVGLVFAFFFFSRGYYFLFLLLLLAFLSPLLEMDVLAPGPCQAAASLRETRRFESSPMLTSTSHMFNISRFEYSADSATSDGGGGRRSHQRLFRFAAPGDAKAALPPSCGAMSSRKEDSNIYSLWAKSVILT